MRRRRDSDAFSLFAFQDIITSVTGIILLVTLLLALELVQQEQLTDTPGRPDAGGGPDVAELKQAVESLRLEVDENKKAIAVLATTPGGVRSEVERLQRLIGELKRRQADIGAPRPPDPTAEPLEKIQADCEALEKVIEALKSKSMVVYNKDPSTSKRGWLVELDPGGITVAEMGGEQGPVVQAAATAAGAGKVSAFTSGKNPQADYFVILIKPGTVALYKDLRSRLQKQGFDLGFDILGRDQSSIQPLP